MDVDGELWAGSEKFIARCPRCGKTGFKRNMTAIYVKENQRPMKILCHLCPSCLADAADFLAVDIG